MQPPPGRRSVEEGAPAPPVAPLAPAPAPTPATGPLRGDVGAALGQLDPMARAEALQRLQAQRGNHAVARLLARQDAGDGGDAAQPSAQLIVPDDAAQVEPHQMTRSRFVAEMRAAATAAAEAALGGSAWGPLLRDRATKELEARLSAYAALDAAGLERAIRDEAPEASGAAAAAGLIGPVADGIRDTIAESVPADDPPAPEVASGLMGLFFKRRRADRKGATADPQATRGALSSGEPLSGSVAERMAPVLGEGFSDVRVHTDAGAARLADRFEARAFTVGSDIAFGAGEYQPGTVIGDALLAHELAHVVQQRGGGTEVAGAEADLGEAALEADADAAAAGAVEVLHGGVSPRLRLARLRSGLRLQRCGNKTKKPEKPPPLGVSIENTMDALNNPDTKVFYWTDFRIKCEQKQVPYTWDEKYRTGWAQTDQMEKTADFTWRLKGKSASAGLTAWLAGLTVADCASVATAAYYKAVLERVGPERFDKFFERGEGNTLLISPEPAKTPLNRFIEDVNLGMPLKEGDLYYFQNHHLYPYKHPAGLWSGENAMYVGGGIWTGFGKSTNKAGMYKVLIERYDDGRSADDHERLKGPRLPDGSTKNTDGSLPRQYRYVDEDGPDGKGTLPIKLETEENLLKGGGGLQEKGSRLNAGQIDTAFPD